MALYLVPIVALPMLVAGFVALVLTVKPPANTQPRTLEATSTREAGSALSGASSRPHKGSGASDLLCDNPIGCERDETRISIRDTNTGLNRSR